MRLSRTVWWAFPPGKWMAVWTIWDGAGTCSDFGAAISCRKCQYWFLKKLWNYQKLFFLAEICAHTRAKNSNLWRWWHFDERESLIVLWALTNKILIVIIICIIQNSAVFLVILADFAFATNWAVSNRGAPTDKLSLGEIDYEFDLTLKKFGGDIHPDTCQGQYSWLFVEIQLGW